MMSDSWSDSEETTYDRLEQENFLYSQIYHELAGEAENVDLYQSLATPESSLKSRSLLVENSPGEPPADPVTSTSPILLSSDGDDSDIQVIREVVTVSETQGSREEEVANSPMSEDEEEEMPFWARLDSGTQLTDSKLHLHIRTHGRQRHDSIMSHNSSVLGDGTQPLVTLSHVNEYGSLEQVLSTLPDSGWDILPTDYRLSNSAKKRMRYHSLKCRNCDQSGHRAENCPKPTKEKVCHLCAEVHTTSKDRRFCPHTICQWCSASGHSTFRCQQQRSIRSMFCHRCGGKGHKPRDCHELWRQWHATTVLSEGCVYPTPPTQVFQREIKYCPQCGMEGHFAHECKLTPWWSLPILSTCVRHYNTSGKPSDFKKTWAKHSTARKTLQKKTKKSDYVAEKLSNDQLSRCKRWAVNAQSLVHDSPSHSGQQKRKRKLVEDSNSQKRKRKLVEDSNGQNTPQSKTVIKRNKRKSNSNVSKSPKQQLAESKTKPKKIKPTKSERKARKKLKEQLGIPVTQSIDSFFANGGLPSTSRKPSANKQSTASQKLANSPRNFNRKRKTLQVKKKPA